MLLNRLSTEKGAQSAILDGAPTELYFEQVCFLPILKLSEAFTTDFVVFVPGWISVHHGVLPCINHSVTSLVWVSRLFSVRSILIFSTFWLVPIAVRVGIK